MYIPNIIQETAQGLGACRVEDQMLTSREIQLSGTVDAESVTALTNQLIYLSRRDPEAPITLYIDSPGGLIDEAMTLYDVMQAVPAPVHTVCIGHAYSMAALLFCAGDHRSMLPHSRVMVHEPYILSLSGDTDQLRSSYQNLECVRQDYCQLMAKHSGQTVEAVTEALHKNTYYTAEEAIQFGLCDEIKRRFD